MSKEAIDRLREKAQNENVVLALNDLCKRQEAELVDLRAALAAKTEGSAIRPIDDFERRVDQHIREITEGIEVEQFCGTHSLKLEVLRVDCRLSCGEKPGGLTIVVLGTQAVQQGGKAVAVFDGYIDGVATIKWTSAGLPVGTRLYAAPHPVMDDKSGDIQREAAIRYEVERLRNAEIFENRVKQLMVLIEKDYKFDWPYTDAFDDGGIAYNEAKRRIAAATGAANS